MESGLKKALGDSTGEDVYGIANLLAISVAAPEMAENGVNLLKNGVNLLKNGVNLIKDGIGAAKDFIKGNKIEEEIENSFKEITGEEKLKVGSYLINDKSEIGKVKTLSEIEKEAEEPSPFDELIGYIEYGDKGKEILEEESVKEIELEDRVFNQVEKGDIESLYKESGIEDIANANPVAS